VLNLLSRIGALAYFALLLVVIAAGVLFHVRNDTLVEVDLYVRSVTLPVSAIAVGGIALGALLGFVAALFPLVVAQGRLHAMRRRQRMAEKELEALRTLPFRDAD